MTGEIRKIGRYQITRELGRGAMGVVYHAIDPTIGRPLAIKTLRLRELDDGDQRLRLRERLFREARSAGALSHPGIVTIYDMDEVDGLAYIAMEFVDGDTLDQLLAQPRGLGRERVAQVLLQTAAALDYAHRKGIVHRDIKPANIMIDTAGTVKITDFGIAKIAQWERQTLTGVLIGTPNYMSPEQVQGQEADGRSDQFSLGVIAYEMLTGARPFHGEQISTVVFKIVNSQPVPANRVNGSLDDGVDKILRRALAKKPERRFASCTAFATALTGALANAKNWRALPAKTDDDHARAASGTEKLAVQRRRWLVLLVSALLFLAAVLGVAVWPDWHPAEQARQAFPSESEAMDPLPNAAPLGQPPLGSESIPVPERRRAMSQKTRSIVRVAATSRNEARLEPVATWQQIAIATNPSGARAALDGSRGAVCRTPCQLRASTGVHGVTITLAGYQAESREIGVGHEDIEYPLITLRSSDGTLLLTSDPSTAQVWVDGRQTNWVTPVRINLAPGAHRVRIEKDGLESSGEVEIGNGALSTLKLGVRRE